MALICSGGMVRGFAERLMASEVDVIFNAGYGAAGRAVRLVSSGPTRVPGQPLGLSWDSTGCTFVA